MDYSEIIRANSRPLEQLSTGVEPVLRPMTGIRAVMFDVYGTLVISGSGDIGVAQQAGKSAALAAAFRAVGYDDHMDPEQGVECLMETIRSHQRQSRAQGVEYPEVDIVEVWRECLNDMTRRGDIGPMNRLFSLRNLLVEYEVRTNPVWPMPNSLECLTRLREMGLAMGIVSNAQFYTLETFPALFAGNLDTLGFHSELQFYSYQYLRAKPGEFLFKLAARALAKNGIDAQNVIYVGNDMLNDIWPASRVGFRTALFAGDKRSLRQRSGDPRVDGVVPDLVLTDLMSLCNCLSSSPPDSLG